MQNQIIDSVVQNYTYKFVFSRILNTFHNDFFNFVMVLTVFFLALLLVSLTLFGATVTIFYTIEYQKKAL